MEFDRSQAAQDFERAQVKAFWRKVMSWITRQENQLLPFDEVRARLPIYGQHHLGLQQVPIDKIVGSLGRYNDFDRAFLPLQTKTRERWIGIDMAQIAQIYLPPVELYKIGEVYFVKDGNHRVSVARQRGQLYIDAYVTEIDVPVPLDTDLTLSKLTVKQEYADFLEKTRLHETRPEANLETNIPGQYERLLEHIRVHRWYLGEQRKAEVPFPDAALSWYEHVYMPIIELLRKNGIVGEFPNFSEVDLYLWVMAYQAILRETYREEVLSEDMPAAEIEDIAREEASRHFAEGHPDLPVRKLINTFKKATWLDEMILNQERANFFQKTRLLELRPQAKITTRMPGVFDRLLEHIQAHQWYIGEQRHTEVPFEEAVTSWYDHVYMPLVKIIREQGILEVFPERTETDLYMWIITRQWFLKQAAMGN